MNRRILWWKLVLITNIHLNTSAENIEICNITINKENIILSCRAAWLNIMFISHSAFLYLLQVSNLRYFLSFFFFFWHFTINCKLLSLSFASQDVMRFGYPRYFPTGRGSLYHAEAKYEQAKTAGCISSLECCCTASAGWKSHSTSDNLASHCIRTREVIMALVAHKSYSSSWNSRIWAAKALTLLIMILKPTSFLVQSSRFLSLENSKCCHWNLQYIEIA